MSKLTRKCISKAKWRTDIEQGSPTATITSAAQPNGWRNPYTVYVSSSMYYEDMPWWKWVSYQAAQMEYIMCQRRGNTGCDEPNPSDYGAGKWHDNGQLAVSLDVSCQGTPGNDGLPGFSNPVISSEGTMSPTSPRTEYDPNDCPYTGDFKESDVPDPTESNLYDTASTPKVKDDTATRTMPVSVALDPATWTSAQGFPNDGDVSYNDPSPEEKSFKWDIKGDYSEDRKLFYTVDCDWHYCS